MDCVRAEDAYTSRLGYEEHIPGQVPAAIPDSSVPSPVGPRLGSRCLWGCTGWQGAGLPPRRWWGLRLSWPVPPQTRDWNEELQTTRELPRKNLPERLLRERAIFKVPVAPEA